MASIPGSILVIIGLAIGISSYVLNGINDTNSLILFAIVGIGMAIYGIVKIIFVKATKPEVQPRAAEYMACPYCSGPVHVHAYYCSRCRTRIRTN